MPMTWNCKELWGIEMKFTLPLLFMISILGCSSLPVGKVDLYTIYLKQLKFEKNNTIIPNRDVFFTKKYLSNFDTSDEKSLFLLNLTNYINEEISHYQKNNESSGCLTVNALDKNNEPVVLYLEYKNSDGLWLVNYTFIHLIENSDNYPKKVLCPREAESIVFK